MKSFVGRVEELARLRGKLERALAGEGGTVFLSAEAGAGKSTLVDYFLAEVAEKEPEALVLRAGCSEQYGAGEPYQPFVEAFRALVHRQAEGKRGRSLKELAKELAPVWIAAIPVAGELIAASLATATELKQTFGKGGGAPVAASEEALFFQYTQLFFAAAEDNPIVLFIDDLHWADRASVSLLTHLARQIPQRRILILGSYRPVDVDVAHHSMRDARQELERYRAAEEISLAPLGTESLAELITANLGAPPSPELLDWLERRAGTNALFFEELLGWLRDRGLIDARHGEALLKERPAEVEIPRSAEATIEKRLERLDEETRRIVEYASVQGNEFNSVTVSRLLDKDELELEEALEPIAKVHRLIRMTDTRDLPNGDLASVYEFSHALIQDVLHKAIQGKRRILLHRKMAQILEEVHRGGDAIAHRLAVHYEEGRLGERAFEFALIAAERASRVYAHWDAIEQIQRALRNAQGDAQAMEAWQRLGAEHFFVGRFPEAIEAFDQAIARAHQAADRPRSIRVHRQKLMAERHLGIRPVSDFVASLRALGEEARELGEKAELCAILWDLIADPGTTEALDIDLAEEALRIARETDDPAMAARGELHLGAALAFGSRPAEGIPHLEEALRHYRELGDRGQEGRTLNTLGAVKMLMGRYDSAAPDLENAAALFDEIVDPGTGVSVRNNLGFMLLRLGEFDRAEAVLLQSIQMAERLGAPTLMLSPIQNLAELYELRDEWESAEDRWSELLRRAAEMEYIPEQIVGMCGLGTARMARGDTEAALELERRARELLGVDAGWSEARETLELFSARLAAATGEREGAAEMLAVAEESLVERDRYLWAVYRLERARWLAASQPEEARTLAFEARQVFEEIGAREMLRRSERLLSESEDQKWAVKTG